VLSKLFPGREGLKAVGVSRVVEQDKDILCRVLDEFMPGLANNFLNGRVDISLGNRSGLVVGSELVGKEIFSKLFNLILRSRASSER
jgi:hypothetical protein